jgi:hypothetical protein
VLAAVGIVISSHLIGPHVYLPTLGWALTIAGVGFGIMLVPVTSTPLTVVRPEHSGMAASVTNTSREMGAVFGVAVLGSIVNSKLTGQLAARLKAEHSNDPKIAALANKVVGAAYDAFGSGLHIALDISAVLLVVGAVVAVTMVHTPPGARYEI